MKNQRVRISLDDYVSYRHEPRHQLVGGPTPVLVDPNSPYGGIELDATKCECGRYVELAPED